jgi:Cof subfamily protein (haloacid dehalogenase superfamily)
MKKIKLVAMDMDGTILDHQGHQTFISDRSKQVIKQMKAAGIITMIATGRSHGLLKDLIVELEMQDDYHVLCNGAATLTPKGEIINLHGIDREDCRLLIQRLSDKKIPFAAFDADLSFCLPHTIETHGDAYRESIVKEDLNELPFITKFVVGPYDHQDMAKAAEGLAISFAHSVFVGVDYAEIWPIGLHKGTAVEAVAKLHGIELDEVLAIGDGGNDSEMLAHVGFGVAMGNANDQVKAHANAVTDTVSNDGLAKAMEKYVLGQQ